MSKRLKIWLRNLDGKVSAKNFALFRILFSAYILLLIWLLNDSRPIIFDQVSGISKSIFPAKLFLSVWGFSAVMLLAGFRTRLFAVANYIMVVLATATFTIIGVGSFNDDILRIGSFLLMFMPVSRHFSIDGLLKRTLYTDYTPSTTSRLNYLAAIFLSLGLLYFGSGITKTYSPIWLKGIGLWLPLSIPFTKWNNFPMFTDTQWLMRLMNYFVMAWEISFIFLFTQKKWQRFLVPSGILFHLAIAIAFPFPLLCLGAIICYIFFLPESFWRFLSDKMQAHRKTIVSYDPASALQRAAAGFLSAIDFRGKFLFRQATGLFHKEGTDLYGHQAFAALLSNYALWAPLSLLLKKEWVSRVLINFYSAAFTHQATYHRPLITSYGFRQTSLLILLAGLTVTQLFFQAYHVYSMIRITPEKRRAYQESRGSGNDFSMKPVQIARNFFGINSRGLFLDHSLSGTKASFIITREHGGKKELLPLFDEKGHCMAMNRNFTWAKLTYHYITERNAAPDTTGLKKFTRTWAAKNRISLDSLELRLYGRSYTYPATFEKGFLEKMENKPWIPEGIIHWKSGVFSYTSLRTDSTARLFR